VAALAPVAALEAAVALAPALEAAVALAPVAALEAAVALAPVAAPAVVQRIVEELEHIASFVAGVQSRSEERTWALLAHVVVADARSCR